MSNQQPTPDDPLAGWSAPERRGKANETNIRWASHRWNPYTANCSEVSTGCSHCYSKTLMSTRFKKQWRGRPRWKENTVKELDKMPSGAVIFVNTMSDTYFGRLPWIHRIHDLVRQHSDKTFLLLTKRIKEAYYFSWLLDYPPNLWVGTSIENNEVLWRLDYLLKIPAAGRFISAEPLLENIAPGLEPYLEQGGIGWVIVGGESGKLRRPFNTRWAADIRDLCIPRTIPFMFKQGSTLRPDQDRLLGNRTWDETPFDPTYQRIQQLEAEVLKLKEKATGIIAQERQRIRSLPLPSKRPVIIDPKAQKERQERIDQEVQRRVQESDQRCILRALGALNRQTQRLQLQLPPGGTNESTN